MSTWGQLTWGSNSWSSDQNNISLSGISLSASLGSPLADGTINIGWGGLAWNEGEWGDLANPNIDVSGIQLSTTLEDVTTRIAVEVLVTGTEITSSLTSVISGTSALVTPNSPSPLATLSLNNGMLL